MTRLKNWRMSNQVLHSVSRSTWTPVRWNLHSTGGVYMDMCDMKVCTELHMPTGRCVIWNLYRSPRISIITCEVQICIFRDLPVWTSVESKFDLYRTLQNENVYDEIRIGRSVSIWPGEERKSTFPHVSIWKCVRLKFFWTKRFSTDTSLIEICTECHQSGQMS